MSRSRRAVGGLKASAHHEVIERGLVGQRRVFVQELGPSYHLSTLSLVGQVLEEDCSEAPGSATTLGTAWFEPRSSCNKRPADHRGPDGQPTVQTTLEGAF